MTYKQKLAASKIVENGGNIGKAMIEAGYSPMTAKTPSKLTRSKGWQELLEHSFPDELLANTQSELLKAATLSYKDVHVTTDDTLLTKELLSVPGTRIVNITTYAEENREGHIKKYKRVAYLTPLYQVRLRAIETILKLKNRFPSQKHAVIENSGPFIVNLVSYDPEDKDASSYHLSDLPNNVLNE